MKDGKCGLHCIGFWLLWVGGVNWGLIGLFDFNLVEVIFGGWPWLVTLVYILVGVSALFVLLGNKCGKCRK